MKLRPVKTIKGAVARIPRLVDALGPTHESAAERLHQQGITGDPFNPCRCPLSHYFRTNLGPCFEVSVSYGNVLEAGAVGYAEIIKGIEAVEVELPGHLAALAVLFDQGDYPQLQRGRYEGVPVHRGDL